MPALEKRLTEFHEAETEVVGISVDSIFSHAAWCKHKIGTISYPLLSDMHHKVMSAYGVHNENGNYANRSVFIVDKNGNVAYKEICGKGQLPDVEVLVNFVRGLK